MRTRAWGGQREREKDSPADAALSTEPNTRLIKALRLWPKLKSRAGHLTHWATQAPLSASYIFHHYTIHIKFMDKNHNSWLKMFFPKMIIYSELQDFSGCKKFSISFLRNQILQKCILLLCNTIHFCLKSIPNCLYLLARLETI